MSLSTAVPHSFAIFTNKNHHDMVASYPILQFFSLYTKYLRKIIEHYSFVFGFILQCAHILSIIVLCYPTGQSDERLRNPTRPLSQLLNFNETHLGWQNALSVCSTLKQPTVYRVIVLALFRTAAAIITIKYPSEIRTLLIY